MIDIETWGMGRARGAQFPPTMRVLNYYVHAYRRTWRSSVTTSFLYPVLYLAAMGVGLGSLINSHTGEIDHVKYLPYIAPGLLAATAMQIAANESMYPVMAAIKWIRTYFAMLSTPLRVSDVLFGHQLWIAVRLSMVSTIYLGVMAAFGTVLSPWAVLALPVALLTGAAFAAPISAYSATQESDMGFITIYRLALVPLFLFSGTFFPVTQLPGWLQPIAYATPLYHGVHACRMLVLGQVRWVGLVWDVSYLLALAAVGSLLAYRSYSRRLVV